MRENRPAPLSSRCRPTKSQSRASQSSARKGQGRSSKAKAAFERNQILAKRKAVSRAVFNKSRNAYEQALAQRTLDETSIATGEAELHIAETSLGHTDIVSPVDGTVVSRRAEMGQMVEASSETPLFQIATDLTLMQVDANVSEKDIGEVKLGDKATFTVETFPNHPFTGEVTQIQPITADDRGRRDLWRGHQRAQFGSVAEAGHDGGDPDRGRPARQRPARTRSGAALFARWPRGPEFRCKDARCLFADLDPARWRANSDPVQLGLDDGACTEVVKGDLKPGDEAIIGEGKDASEKVTAKCRN